MSHNSTLNRRCHAVKLTHHLKNIFLILFNTLLWIDFSINMLSHSCQIPHYYKLGFTKTARISCKSHPFSFMNPYELWTFHPIYQTKLYTLCPFWTSIAWFSRHKLYNADPSQGCRHPAWMAKAIRQWCPCSLFAWWRPTANASLW